MKSLLSILILIFTWSIQGQGLRHYDSLTYAQFQNQESKELKTSVKEALSEGYDFYYLRMRMGIVYFEQGKYELALPHFRKSYAMSTDHVVAEYLFYSLLWSGRYLEAQTFLCENRELLASIPHRCTKWLSGTYAEAGIKKRNGTVQEIGDISFYHFGFYHQPTGRLNIYQGYSRVKQAIYSFDTVSVGGQGPGFGNPNESIAIQNDVGIIQNEYYLSVAYLLTKMIKVSPAFHYQGVNYGPDNTALSFRIDLRGKSINGYFGTSFSTINSNRQQLYTAGLTLYPLGNQVFYLNTDINHHKQDNLRSQIFNSRIGLQLFRTVQMEAMYGWGDLYNYSDLNAFYLYNIPDVMRKRMNVSAAILIAQKHQIKVGYLFEDKYNEEVSAGYQHRGFFVSLNLVL